MLIEGCYLNVFILESISLRSSRDKLIIPNYGALKKRVTSVTLF